MKGLRHLRSFLSDHLTFSRLRLPSTVPLRSVLGSAYHITTAFASDISNIDWSDVYSEMDAESATAVFLF